MGAYVSTNSCDEAEDPAACERPIIIASGVTAGVCFLIVLSCFCIQPLRSRLESRRRETGGDSERTRRNASSSRRSRRKEHQHASCSGRRTSHRPPRRPDTSRYVDSSFASSTPSFYPRTERVSTRAPSRPPRASRRSEDREIENLLRELPTVRCSRRDRRTCTICFHSLSNTSAIVTSCRHQVHTRCLTNWLQTSRKRSCPTCRARLFVNR